MVKNTPEALQKIVENLILDLYKHADCSEWECEECPFFLTEIVEEPPTWTAHCGWLLLKSVTSKIMRK